MARLPPSTGAFLLVVRQGVWYSDALRVANMSNTISWTFSSGDPAQVDVVVTNSNNQVRGLLTYSKQRIS